MVTVISFLLVVSAILLAVPVAVLLIEVIAAAMLPRRSRVAPSTEESHGRLAVLIPAHNEGANLLPTLADINAQMREGDRLFVVADNCSDDTAAVAAAAGANVVERNQPDRIGKGYALAWGLRHLDADPPDLVIMFDADCRLAPSTIDRLAAACATAQRPVQAPYLMISSDDSPINTRVAEFAWRLKNWVRPSGLEALSLPCQLMGTGMAFPWNLIRSADLASALLVEDLKLGLDMALVGKSPLFLPSAGVTSTFPHSREGLQSQRRRWEEGHVKMILARAPRLILAAATQANLGLLALTFDLMVPPLTLLGILLIGMLLIAGSAKLLGISPTAMFVTAASLVGFISVILISWLRYGRDILPAGSLLLIPAFVLGKFPLYCTILSRKFRSGWVRTDRRKL